MPFIISGTASGRPVYWRKWTSPSASGRPKWVDRLTLKCCFVQETIANNTAAGNGSGHFSATKRERDGTVVPVTNIQVEEIQQLP